VPLSWRLAARDTLVGVNGGGYFEHGVASGDPLSDGVIIWTRVSVGSGGPIEVMWQVCADSSTSDVIASGAEIADPSADHTVKVEVTGLEPATTYFYSFETLGERSPVGRTRTLSADGCDGVRFAVCSCAKYTAGYFNAYGRIAERPDLDFVLHLGDYIYEYPTHDGKAIGPQIGREMDPPHECRSLEDYRRRYALHRRDPDVQRLHATHPMISTLDDHEICNDTWRDGAKYHDPNEDGPWSNRKAAALKAWHEWIPVRPPNVNDLGRVYRSFSLGGLADLIVLDGRSYRDEQVRGDALDDNDRTVLGKEQYEWFVSQLAHSEATWRLVANSVMIGQVYTGFLPDEVGRPLSEVGILTHRDLGPDPDQWDGYPAERDRLFRFIENTPIRNSVFLSGDVHTAWAVDVKKDPFDDDEIPLAVEFVTTSVTSENLDEEMHTEPRTKSVEIERQVVDDNPHVRWVELDSHGYVLVDLTHERVQGDWYFVDTLRRRNDNENRAAGWIVDRDQHRLREATDPIA
jgi:alkaline phosphatase D